MAAEIPFMEEIGRKDVQNGHLTIDLITNFPARVCQGGSFFLKKKKEAFSSV